jgi:ApaG protein
MTPEANSHTPQGPIELDGLWVRVDELQFHPELQAPEDKPYPIVYFITIHNDSDRTVTFHARKWVITDKFGDKIVVEGEGIVGQKPRLAQGETWSYNSYHVIGADSVAEGSYHGIDDLGRRVFVKIPRFELKMPAQG